MSEVLTFALPAGYRVTTTESDMTVVWRSRLRLEDARRDAVGVADRCARSAVSLS
jgi:hypothetical protein